MSQLVNTVNDENEESLPHQSLTIPEILIWPKNYVVLKVLTKIQFHHNHLNLTNINHLRTVLTIWQVITSLKLKLNMNATLRWFNSIFWINIESDIFTRFEPHFLVSIDSCTCKSWIWIINLSKSHSIDVKWMWTLIFWFEPNSWANFDSRIFTWFESDSRVSIGLCAFNSWAQINYLSKSHSIVG